MLNKLLQIQDTFQSVLLVTLIFFAYFLSEDTNPIKHLSDHLYICSSINNNINPNLIGLQNNGEAQVLSNTVGIFFFFAILVINGISKISNVAVPGDSKKINFVFFEISFSKFLILFNWVKIFYFYTIILLKYYYRKF